MSEGVDALREIPRARWEAVEGPRRAALLEEIDRFDADFFAVAPREAAQMDPQQRLLLEVAWEALEDAGIAVEAVRGTRGGVFMGGCWRDWAEVHRDLGAAVTPHTGTGQGLSLLANRVSYFLGLRGPSLTVDTASSSSLVAVHLACRALHDGEVDLALAGGVSLLLSPVTQRALASFGALSPDGRSRPFSAAADGYGRGEGAGVVVLKRLADALADGDRIYGLIRGGAVNHDGAGGGLTVPSVEAQEELLRSACADAGVDPAEVLYVEAHGSGTRVGDPIEAAALGRVYGKGRAAEHPLLVGSVKGNIGHLEAAAGVAGLIKTALALHHRTLPASLHCAEPHPGIPFAELGLRVLTREIPWPEPADGRVLAAVSSFGWGGTNSHLLLEAAPPVAAPPVAAAAPEAGQGELFVLSAHSAEALRALAAQTAEAVAAGDAPLAAHAAHASRRRSQLEHRLALVAGSPGELSRRLAAFAAEGEDAAAAGRADPEHRPRLAFVFSGQGTQAAQMGCELRRREPVVGELLDRCHELFRTLGGLSLIDELEAPEERSRLAETAIAQPALFALQMAVAGLWTSWVGEPEAVAGHSVGEVAAACVAGALDLEEGARVAFHRGRLMQDDAARGAMAALDLPEADVEALLQDFDGEVAVAAVNAPASTTVCGAAEAVERLLALLAARGVSGRRLRVGFAFHGPRLQPAADALVRALDGLQPRPPRLPVVSTVTGAWAGPGAFDAAYWGRNVRRPVRFAAAVETLLDRGCTACVEIGPHPALLRSVAETAAARPDGGSVTALPSLWRGMGERASLLGSLGTLWTAGRPVDWRAVHPGTAPVLARPAYPFQRSRHWPSDAPPPVAVAAADEPREVRKPPDLPARLAAVEPDRRRGLLLAHVQAEVARVLGRDPSRPLEPRRRLFDAGLDSMLAFELRARLERAIGRPLRPTALFNHATAEAIADHLLEELGETGETGERAIPPALPAPDAARPAAGEPIAVIGLACRFPGADDEESFWRLLRDGVDAVTEIPADRWAPAELEALFPGAGRARWGGFLADPGGFDAAFFKIPPGEAATIDPQQRLVLEVAWEALEAAGVAPDRLEGSATGVFVGAMTNDWALLQHRAGLAGITPQLFAGTEDSFLAGRLSYLLGLRGPSLVVSTACSSSLAAVHLACRSLRAGDCDLALAGGVNVMAAPEWQLGTASLRALAADGRCKTFDAAADGYVRGEGCGVVVLKRLSAALAAGDPVRAVLRGTAVNHDGASGGLTVPSGAAQQEVVLRALRDGGVAPTAVSYVEAHGSGTAVGDPIELEALQAVLGAARSAPLVVGSVKTNVGHLEAAAGMAGLIKVILALGQGAIPPSLHFRSLNPLVRCPPEALAVPTALTPWPRAGAPRIAGVSSFGLSGVNAHVLVEEAPEPPWDGQGETVERAEILVLSAASSEALEAATDRLAAHLAAHPELALADVAATLQSGRAALGHRRAVVARSTTDAAQALRRIDPRRVLTGSAAAAARPVAFLLPGVGDHFPDMALGLYREEPGFRAVVDRCAELLLPHLGEDLRDTLLPGRLGTMAEPATPAAAGPDLRRLLRRGGSPEPAADAAAGRLQRTELAQPAVLVVELALAALLESWGIRPAALLGYSLGEYTAACLAGVFSLEDTLALVAERARQIAALPAGAMLAVPLSEARLGPLLGAYGLSLAAVNGAEMAVASGPAEGVAALRARLAAEGVAAALLPTTHAFHSWMMEPAAAWLEERVRSLRRSEPRIPLLLNRTGTWAEPGACEDPVSWARHLCEPVRCAADLDALLRDRPGLALLEVGPGQSLSSFALQAAGAPDLTAVPALRHREDPAPDREVLLGAVARLWLSGVDVSWEGLRAGRGRRVPLPAYPFEHRRYWLDTAPEPAAARSAPAAPVRREDPADWVWAPVWRQSAPLPARAPEPARWLVLADPGSLAEAVIERLRAAGAEVVVVRAGTGFRRLGEREYTVDPVAADDHRRLLEDLGEVPRRVLHLWDLAAEEELEAVIDRAFHGLLALARAYARQAPSAEAEIAVLTRCALQVTGGERLRPAAAAAHGAGRVLAQEYPRLSCRVLDLDPPPGGRREAAAVAWLAAELAAPRSEAPVAWRGGGRWVRSFEPVRLEAGGAPERLRRGGVYLLTGGLGEVGFALAEDLARRVAARLVLTGRTALPAREAWDAWLAAQPEDDPVSRGIRRVRRLESLGAAVEVVAADVADAARMQAAVAFCLDRFGALDGVVHAAGDTRREALRHIPETGRADAAVHFRAKLRGAEVLAEVLAGRRLDFVLLCSSISTVLGGLGFAAYAAANLSMETLAERCDAAGDTPWIAVAWDTWRLGERLRSEAAAGGNVGVTLAGLDMAAGEGCEVFRRLLAGWPSPRVVISTADLRARLAQWVERPPAVPEPAGARPAGPRRSPRPELPAPYVAPAGDLERTIATLWEEVLGFERVGAEDSFFALGGHSLLAARFLSLLREQVGLDLPVRAVFEAPTPASLAASVGALLWMERGADRPLEAGVLVEGEL